MFGEGGDDFIQGGPGGGDACDGGPGEDTAETNGFEACEVVIDVPSTKCAEPPVGAVSA